MDSQGPLQTRVETRCPLYIVYIATAFMRLQFAVFMIYLLYKNFNFEYLLLLQSLLQELVILICIFNTFAKSVIVFNKEKKKEI